VIRKRQNAGIAVNPNVVALGTSARSVMYFLKICSMRPKKMYGMTHAMPPYVKAGGERRR
jgi:hypothetical protein